MSAYYVTEDPAMVQMWRDYVDALAAWGKALNAIGDELGRKIYTSRAFCSDHFVGFTLKDGESHYKADWVGTPFVLVPGKWIEHRWQSAYLRVRKNPAGKDLRERLAAIKPPKSPCDGLEGIPQRNGQFGLGSPGMFASADGTRLVLTYTEPVEHDDRWREIKASEYHAMREEIEAAKEDRVAS